MADGATSIELVIIKDIRIRTISIRSEIFLPWKEFEGYMNSKGKLKSFRSEAIRVGFSRLWKDKNYQAIVNIAERLPESTIQEDPNLLMYYDISLGRV